MILSQVIAAGGKVEQVEEVESEVLKSSSAREVEQADPNDSVHLHT